MHRHLTIPCETQTREFDAKLLLACCAAERGYRVTIGEKKRLNRRIGTLPVSIYLSKSLTSRNLKIYRLLHQFGHRVVLGDEEGLVYPSAETYVTTKVGADILSLGDAMLAWGEECARVWRAAPGYRGAPIHVTGNPRIDLLRPELSPYFAQEAKALRGRYGQFVLINTNFSRINHYLPGESRHRKALDEGIDAHNPDVVGLARHKQLLFEGFKAMVPALARSLPEFTIVLRPHPSESDEVWKRCASGCGNVVVLNQGAIAPWLMAADAVVHNGCTTAIEAYVLGTPAVAYQPVTSERYDLDLPNALSERVSDTEQLVSVLHRLIEQGVSPQRAEQRAEVAMRHLSGLQGPLAADRIIDALETVDPPPGNFAASWGVRFELLRRNLRKAIEARIPAHRNSSAYLEHMFPGVGLDAVRVQIQRYGELLGRFAAVRVSQVDPNVFRVTPAP